jgi:hypothetical protein
MDLLDGIVFYSRANLYHREKAFKNKLNVRTEAYYQYLYRVPVTVQSSAFSLINMGSGFSRFFPDQLKNTGKGYNYGTNDDLRTIVSEYK